MNTEITIVLRSVTHAEKSKKLLNSEGIKSRIVKPSPSVTGKGCGYGIAVAAPHADAAVGILKNNRIPIVKLTRV